MKNLSIISAVILSLFSLSANAKIVETNEIQIVVNPATALFAANIGGSIVDNPMDIIPAGSTVTRNGLIFPKNTVSLSQSSFLVDRHGQPLTELNSIGTWVSSSTELVEFDPENPPALGTILEQSLNSFIFNSNDPNKPNEIFTIGNVELINNPIPQSPVSVEAMVVLGGTGKNQSASGHAMAQAFIAPDGMSTLIVVKFDKKIKFSTTC